MGKIIYKPSGKAQEYSQWAANFYNGCWNNCMYCYNNHSLMSKTLGGSTVRLKSTLVDEATAYNIFCNELDKYKDSIINDGSLHFNFVSDPCLDQTIDLNWKCIDYAISQNVPCQVLTKRADWVNNPSVQNALSHPELLNVGFSLTGCDDLEPNASTNTNRIWAMHVLHKAGISTWASIEPILIPQRSLDMIERTIDCCDHYKIGILSGKKDYTPQDIRDFINAVNQFQPISVYWKKSLLDFIQKP